MRKGDSHRHQSNFYKTVRSFSSQSTRLGKAASPATICSLVLTQNREGYHLCGTTSENCFQITFLHGFPSLGADQLRRTLSEPTDLGPEAGPWASWDPGYAPASSSCLLHPQIPQSSQWDFHANLWASERLQQASGVEETKACMVGNVPSWGAELWELCFVYGTYVCNWCSIHDFSNPGPPNTGQSREGGGAFMIIITVSDDHEEGVGRMPTVHWVYMLCVRQ